MSLHGLEIREKARIISSKHRQRQQETVCSEQLVWMPVQLTWETTQTTDAFAAHGPGLLQAESLLGNYWSEYFVLHLPCVNTLFAMPRTHRAWKLGLLGCCEKPEQSLPYLRISFNANNSHRTMNIKSSRSQYHSPIYGRMCNIDMNDIICGFIWSIT